MAQVQLTAATRTETGKEAAHRLRRRGSIPAILYGGSLGNVALAVNLHDLYKILSKGTSWETTLINLSIQQEGETKTVPVIIKDLQIHPVKRSPIHADFWEVSMEQVIEVNIPVQLVGEAAGIKAGGLLEFSTREIAVECLPTKMVDHFDVDISALNIGESFTVAKLSLGEDYKILTDPAMVIAAIVTMAAEKEEEKVEGAAPAEPEVIQKGKKEEEEAK